MSELELSAPRRIHIIGVGGAGMSAIAEVLATMGHEVSGSDLRDSVGLERLRSSGVSVAVGHDAANLGGAEAVAVSTAIPGTNVEVVAAESLGLPVLRRAEILRAITAVKRTAAVAGTHGKTTTSSMLALVLREAGMQPSFIIGGEVNEIGSGAVWDDGEWLVVEADESDGTFLALHAEAVIVSSVEPDHLEYYGGVDAMVAAFERFVGAPTGPVLVCADDEGARALGSVATVVTYGSAADADYRMVDLVTGRTGSSFTLLHDGEEIGRVELPVPGAHNARNAAGATALALELGAPFEAAVRALGRFAGVARRFQFRGERDGVTFVDDYAHLPTEVRAALSTARDGGWDRVVCVFQPHRYSRTAALATEFADVFGDADLLVLTDVYPSGESPRPGVSGKMVVDAVLDRHPWRALAYLPRRGELVGFLDQRLRPGDLCLTLGAGDLTSLPDELKARG